jgi:hypothetical protein
MKVSSDDPAPRDGRTAALLERVAAVPGVEAVATHNCTPFLVRECPFARVGAVDGVAVESRALPPFEVHSISPEYLRVMRLELLSGDALPPFDPSAAGSAMLVNERAARLLWPEGNAVGRSVTWSARGEPEPPDVVVGVVADARYEALDREAGPAVYLASNPASGASLVTLYVRTRDDNPAVVPAIRQAVAEVDQSLAVYETVPLTRLVADAASTRRFVSVLLAVFACIALFVAALGVYGVLAYLVRQRTRELAVRLALGAAPIALVSAVARHGVTLTVLGLVLGLLGALAGGRLLSTFLFGVTSTDLVSFGGAVATVAVAGLGASLLPAFRAARTDPAVTLRE